MSEIGHRDFVVCCFLQFRTIESNYLLDKEKVLLLFVERIIAAMK
jgi:hypothetical protein